MRNEITAETKYVAQTLVTDTMVWEIIGRTPKGLKLRSTRSGGTVETDGNSPPVVWTEQLSDPDGLVKSVRLRQDGTYRTGQGANPLHPCRMIDGKPVSRTDYKW